MPSKIDNAAHDPARDRRRTRSHIVGQHAAKRAVAIALRNRWRRMQLARDLRNEVTPKNILMIGPTGVGKTEIARRLATLANAPFVKVEATRFTEVGYVGKDVEQIIRDLVDTAVKMYARTGQGRACARRPRTAPKSASSMRCCREAAARSASGATNRHGCRSRRRRKRDTRQKFRKQLREGKLDDREIELETSLNVGVDIMAPPGMEEMGQQLRRCFPTRPAARRRSGTTVRSRPRGRC
jgi:ATP-dependent HslUV protease ATP-binding subunit HslU